MEAVPGLAADAAAAVAIRAGEPAVPTFVVKSAGRALQILEFFDVIQRKACVSEISSSLGYPQSSTSVLLRSLVAMGYLRHDSTRRKYFPTRRVSLLGNWVDPGIVQRGALLATAERLSAEAGETVVMATLNGVNAQYIYAQRQSSTRPALAIGAMLPLPRTTVGHALISSFDDAYVSRVLRRVNAERHQSEEAIDVSGFMADLRIGRKRGWFAGPGSCHGDLSVAAVVEADRQGQMLAIGVEGPPATMEARIDMIAEMLTRATGALAAGQHTKAA